MELMKIAIIVVITLIVATLLKTLHSELATFPVLLLTVTILIISIDNFFELYTAMIGMLTPGFARTGFAYLLKVTGICLMTDFVSDFANDLDYGALANAVSLAGRIAMMTCVMPLIVEIVDF